MRLPYPTRININHVLIVAVLLLFAQLLDGTDPVFAFLACLTMVFSAIAFNVLDGLATTSGAFVFFLAIPTFLILLFLKVFTWEPTNRHFEQPMITITATAIGWAGILAAAGLSRRFSTRRNFVHFTARDLENLKNTSAGLLVIGLFSQILLTNYNTGGTGTIWTALNQLNIFIPMATILATYYEICISRGTRSMNWIVIVSIFYVAGFGFIAASKQGMYTPVLVLLSGVRRSGIPVPTVASDGDDCMVGIRHWIPISLGAVRPCIDSAVDADGDRRGNDRPAEKSRHDSGDVFSGTRIP